MPSQSLPTLRPMDGQRGGWGAGSRSRLGPLWEHSTILQQGKGEYMFIGVKERAIEAMLKPPMVEAMMQSVNALPDLGNFLRRPDWRARSACRGQDIRGFFPDGRALGLETLRVCARCPVSVECLEFALAKPSLKGLWAGTSERERGRMRVAMRRGSSSAL